MLPVMSRSGPICSLVFNWDLAYEKNDLESLLISAASVISKSPLAFLTVCVALLNALIPILFVVFCVACLSVLLTCLSLLSDRFPCFSVHPYTPPPSRFLSCWDAPAIAFQDDGRMSPGSPLLLRCLLSTHPTRLVLVRPVFTPSLLCCSPQLFVLFSDSLSSTIRLKLMTLWSLFERGGRIVVSSIMCSSVLRIRSSMFSPRVGSRTCWVR